MTREITRNVLMLMVVLAWSGPSVVMAQDAPAEPEAPSQPERPAFKPEQDQIPPQLRSPRPANEPVRAIPERGEDGEAATPTPPTPPARVVRPLPPITPIGVDPKDSSRRVMISRPVDIVALESNATVTRAQAEKAAEYLRTRQLENERKVIAELDALEVFDGNMLKELRIQDLMSHREKLDSMVFRPQLTQGLLGAGAIPSRGKDQNERIVKDYKDAMIAQARAASPETAMVDLIRLELELGLLEARAIRTALIVEGSTRMAQVAEGAQLPDRTVAALKRLAVTRPPAAFADWVKHEQAVMKAMEGSSLDDRIAFLQEVIRTRPDADKPLMIPADMAAAMAREEEPAEPASQGG